MESNSNRPELRGKVIEIMDPQTYPSGFTKRDIAIDTGFKFSNPVKISFKKDMARHLDGVAVGDAVIIPFAVDGRIWDGPNGRMYFVDITGLGLTKVTAGGASAPAATAATAKPASAKEAALTAWKQRNGENWNAMGEFCKPIVPGKASKDFTDAEWNAVKAAIEAQDQQGADDPDDLPF